MTTPTTRIWAYRETTLGMPTELTGYTVEAIDGDIGKIDKARNEVGSACIVVDTGPWIFGKKVLIPAGVIRDIDREHRHRPPRIRVDEHQLTDGAQACYADPEPACNFAPG
jgi:hypothetical protein